MTDLLPVVAVTFDAEPEVRGAVADALKGAASLAFLSDVGAERRAATLRSAAALLSWNPQRELGAEGLAELAGVRFMQLMSAGANHLPYSDIPHSLVVASNVGAYAEPMAEHVLAMALSLAKRLPQKHAELARGEFRQRPPTRRIEGLVCGILGFGAIGKAVARRFRPLGVRIQAVNTSGTTQDEVEFVGTLGDLDAVLGASDIVVIALPLNKATDGLLGREELGLMKPDAILINVARAGILQEAALYEHRARRGAGSGEY